MSWGPQKKTNPQQDVKILRASKVVVPKTAPLKMTQKLGRKLTHGAQHTPGHEFSKLRRSLVKSSRIMMVTPQKSSIDTKHGHIFKPESTFSKAHHFGYLSR